MADFSDPKGDFNPYAPPSATADVQMSEGEDEVQILAERGTRWWARFVDNLLLAAASIPGILVMVMADRSGLSALGILLFVIPAALIGYQWYLVANRGQTLGKKWMSIKVVKLDGSPVNFVSGVVMREWIVTVLGLIPTVGGLLSLVDALMIFGQERRCLHDQIAGTKVVLAIPVH